MKQKRKAHHQYDKVEKIRKLKVLCIHLCVHKNMVSTTKHTVFLYFSFLPPYLGNLVVFAPRTGENRSVACSLHSEQELGRQPITNNDPPHTVCTKHSL